MVASSRHSGGSSAPRRRARRFSVARALRVAGPVALALLPSMAAGQELRVGGAVLAPSSDLDGPAFTEFEARRGFGAEVFADVVTPVPPLEVRIGARLVRHRTDQVGGGGAEVDWLAFPLAVAPRLHRGPASVMALAGVEVAYPLATRRSPDLENGFSEVVRTGISGVLGAELAVDLTAGWRLGVEGRWIRGLTPTFDGTDGRLHSRTREWSVRLSRLR